MPPPSSTPSPTLTAASTTPIAGCAPTIDPFWVVTKHADILEVSRQNALFHSGDLATTIVGKAADAKVREMTGGSPHMVRSLVQMDAPDHPKYRALTQAWFMPPNIRGLEERIRTIARASVDRMLATGGQCDFVREVALHYPLHVVMEIPRSCSARPIRN
jgi:cytochrome P450